MTGKIIKGIGGFYYVVCENGVTYECKAKGVFRNRKIKPLVGDNVEIEILDAEKNLGNIEDILPRFNWLNRPAVANVDQTVIIFAVSAPAPNFNLLDRFLINMEQHEVPTIICFNKIDLEGFRQSEDICRSYTKSGYEVLFISAESGYGINTLEAVIKGKTTVFAGPSGVGKSSTLNSLFPDANVQTGGLSEKIQRGKHTTRHSELMFVDDDTYIMDTPGFSTLYIPGMEKEDLKGFYPEFRKWEPYCRFQGCNHISEPDCGVRQGLEEGSISLLRYENYKLLYEELKAVRKY